jgi:hypothetical protein
VGWDSGWRGLSDKGRRACKSAAVGAGRCYNLEGKKGWLLVQRPAVALRTWKKYHVVQVNRDKKKKRVKMEWK